MVDPGLHSADDRNQHPETGRPPPHDIDAEATVLAQIMHDGTGKVVDEIGFLKPEDFYSEAHRRVYEAALECHSRGKPTDVGFVGAWLRDHDRMKQVGGVEYLHTLTNLAYTANVVRYARRIADKARVRKVIWTCQMIAAEGYSFGGEADEYVDSAEARLSDIARGQTATAFETYATVVRRVARQVADSAKIGRKLQGLTTGFSGLDRKIHGLRESRLHIVAARPGIGKTSLTMNIAMNVAKSEQLERGPEGDRLVKNHVAFFTLEMDNDELATRGVSSEASIDQNRMFRSEMLRDDWARLTEAAQNADRVNAHFCDDAKMTVFRMRALCRRLRADVERRAGRLALVVVDYLQLMESHDKRKNDLREQEIARLSRGCKLLAKELKAPVIVVSQLNRAGASRSDSRPQLTDLRESGALEQDADVVIFVHPIKPAPGQPEPREGEPKPHEIIVAKARGGSTGSDPVMFEGQYTRFRTAEGREAEPTGDWRDPS